MLNYVDIFHKYGVPRGVVHCGAQLFHIRKLYLAYGLLNTVWIEPQQFFYDFGKNQIVGTDEKLYDWLVTNENTITKLFEQNQIRVEDYNYLHLSIPAYIGIGLDIFNHELKNFKYITVEVTANIDDESTDLKNVKNWFVERNYKLVDKRIIDNIGQLFFVKKRKYTKK